MDRIEVYTFEDAEGQEFGTFTTQDIKEAQEYAARNGLKLIARIFKYADSEVVDDYTTSSEEEDTDE